MLSEKDFSELSSSLASGFQTDNLVRIVARIQKAGKVEPEQRQPLETAVDIIRQARRGEQWLDSKRFDSQSFEAAVAFDRAASALIFHTQTRDDFDSVLQKLERTLRQMAAGDLPPETEISDLRNFLGHLSKRTLAESQKIVTQAGEAGSGGGIYWQNQPAGNT